MATQRKKSALTINPKAAADEMIRLLGDDAANVARERAAMFLAAEDLENARTWLAVHVHVLEMLRTNARNGEAIH